MRKRKKSLKIFTIILIAAIGMISILAMIGLVKFTRASDYVELDIKKIITAENSVTVLDKDGNALKTSKKVEFENLSKNTVSAFLAIEDCRFYRHNGVDYKGVLRAAAKNISARKFVEGGSTITQQLVKNTHLSNKKTLRRKINEFLLAFQLEQRMNKNEILEAYLNTVYFGNNCVGLARASDFYFGKKAEDLTLSEAATLAGLLKSPNYYSPDANPENSEKRRNLVLEKMTENGYITAETAEAAKLEKIVCVKNESVTSFYVDSALLQAAEILGISVSEICRGDYKIQTYYDSAKTARLTEAVREQTADFGFTPNNVALIIDNDTHGIPAAVGNTGSIFSVRRQVGSLLKPLAVYGPALDTKQICVATPVLDEEISFGSYRPQNYGGKYAGWTTVTDALSGSLNIPAIKTLNMLGISTAKNYLSRNGIQVTEKDDNLTLALGCVSEGASPLEIAAAYSALANGGKRYEPSFVKSVWLDGKLIYEHAPRPTAVFSAQSSYLLTYMLQETVKTGTAKALSDLKFDVAAKTGTVGADDNSDLYMCGYTTQETFFVWYGDEKSRIDKTLSAGKICGKICENYLSAGEKPEKFTVPYGIAWEEYDKNALLEKHILKRADYRTDSKIVIPVDITQNY